MTDRAEFQKKLKALGNNYAAQLPEQLNQIQHVWESISGTAWDDEGFEKLYRLVHNPTGSGNSFGFKMIGDVSHALEECLKPLIAAKQTPNQEQRNRVQDLIRELYQAASYRQ